MKWTEALTVFGNGIDADRFVMYIINVTAEAPGSGIGKTVQISRSAVDNTL